jgi:hypothetical protein
LIIATATASTGASFAADAMPRVENIMTYDLPDTMKLLALHLPSRLVYRGDAGEVYVKEPVSHVAQQTEGGGSTTSK